mmetsp:Transcript_29499/g.38013  ORF Transcript_29499/g.38013 Transcript_29499/m.38013 type:complete len:549 (-) Transcript_29499:685-2331(-)
MPKLVADGLSREEFDNVISLAKVEAGYGRKSKKDAGLDLHFSRIEKIVEIQAGGGGMLSSDAPNAGEMKSILKNVSGEAKAGEILAIMGPSGSGKTSLLDVLAGRGGYSKGLVTINQIQISKEMKRSIAYVMQSDLFFEHLSVLDTLTYTALLRLPRTWSRERKVEEVHNVINRLRLQSCIDTPINLVSGGEKKRTNIGTELLTNPKVLLLDEPTSGLDSTSAVALMKTLKDLAAEGRTILTSIHQPSSGVFASFDRLLLLADGSVVYFGTPKGSLSYFADLGYPCPPGYNAADHCMDLLVVDSAMDNEEEDKEGGGKGGGSMQSTRAKLILAWKSEQGALAIEKARNNMAKTTKQSGVTKTRKYESSYLTQMTVLTHRSLKNKRSALFTKMNFLKSVGLGVISGCCWWQMDDSEALVQDRAGFAFFAMTYWIFDSMFEAMMAFPAERLIMEKERNSGSYHLSAYFLAKTFSEAPCRLLMPAIYIIISYFMSNMRLKFESFIGFAVAELLGVLVGESIGLLIGTTVSFLSIDLTLCLLYLANTHSLYV